MLIQAQVGNQSANDGFTTDLRAGRGGELMVSRLNPREYELVRLGKVFTASNQAVKALSTLNVTCTGFALSNPLGSGTNLVLLDVCVALVSAPAGIASVHIAAQMLPHGTAVVHGTPLTVRNCLLGGSAAGVGLADRAATLPAAPVAIRAIGGGPVAASSLESPFIKDEVGGQIILAPGTNVSLGYVTTAINVMASMSWAELGL